MQGSDEIASLVKTCDGEEGTLGFIERPMIEEETPEGAYDRRIRMVIGYICSHLQDALSGDHLSEVAGFSKYHFHRQQLRDFPCFFQYIKRVPVVQEHEQVTDVYLPIY